MCDDKRDACWKHNFCQFERGVIKAEKVRLPPSKISWSVGSNLQILTGLRILDFQELRRPCWVPGYCAAEELRFVSSVRWLLGEAEPALCG